MKAALTYHSLDDSRSAISVSPQAFARHLAWLASGRVRVLSLDALADHDDATGDAVAVTFDDGFLNTRGAIEQLNAAGLPSTLFVVTGHVGKTSAWGGRADRRVPTLPLLDWTDLERLAAGGAAIESHTRSHTPLTELSADAMDEELGGSQEDLRARLGVSSTHLAYPYGAVNETVAAHAAMHFQSAYTTDFRPTDASDARLELPRLDAYYMRAPGILESWGTPAFARRLRWWRTRRQIRAMVGRGRAASSSAD